MGTIFISKNAESAGDLERGAKIFVDVSYRCRRIWRAAEFTGVFLSLAVRMAELFAFADAPRRVQSLTYESDTSIDDHDI